MMSVHQTLLILLLQATFQKINPQSIDLTQKQSIPTCETASSFINHFFSSLKQIATNNPTTKPCEYTELSILLKNVFNTAKTISETNNITIHEETPHEIIQLKSIEEKHQSHEILIEQCIQLIIQNATEAAEKIYKQLENPKAIKIIIEKTSHPTNIENILNFLKNLSDAEKLDGLDVLIKSNTTGIHLFSYETEFRKFLSTVNRNGFDATINTIEKQVHEKIQGIVEEIAANLSKPEPYPDILEYAKNYPTSFNNHLREIVLQTYETTSVENIFTFGNRLAKVNFAQGVQTYIELVEIVKIREKYRRNITSIAAAINIKKLIDMDPKTDKNLTKQLINKVKTELPITVQEIIWGHQMCIQNKYGSLHDVNSVAVFSKLHRDLWVFEIKQNNSFHIRNARTGRYLVAGKIFDPFATKRYVYTKAGIPNMSEVWIIQPFPTGFRISHSSNDYHKEERLDAEEKPVGQSQMHKAFIGSTEKIFTIVNWFDCNPEHKSPNLFNFVFKH